MEPAIVRVLILLKTLSAHQESLHRCIGTVIREGFDDAVSGTAIGAISEGVEIPPVQGVEYVMEAVGTNSDIGEYESGFCTRGVAVPYFKMVESYGIEESRFEALDKRSGRFFRWDSEQEFLQRRGIALDFDHHSLCRVVDPSGEFQFGRKPVHEGSKSHALDSTSDDDPQPLTWHVFHHAHTSFPDFPDLLQMGGTEDLTPFDCKPICEISHTLAGSCRQGH